MDMVRPEIQTIIKGNDLINAKYSLTMTQLKLVLCAIAQIHPDDDDFKTYEIDTREYTDLTGSHNKGESTRLRAVTLDLMRKPIELPTLDGYEQMNFISYAKYLTNQSKVQIRFDPAMKPHLLSLKKRFTKYRLHYVMQMQSYYSIRLYEMLKQYAPIGRRIVNMAQLHDVLQTPKSYRHFGNFRNRVLEPARDEINDKTDICISYEVLKTGRSVSEVVFRIQKQTTEPLLEEESNDKELIKSQLVSDFDLTSNQADNVLEKYDLSYITDVLNHVLDAQEKGKIRNLAAYTWKAITDDYRFANPAQKDENDLDDNNQKVVKQDEPENKLEKAFESARDKAIAELMEGYDFTSLIEGFEMYLVESNSFMYDFVKKRALEQGEELDMNKHYKHAHVQFKQYLADTYLAECFHSFEQWHQAA